MNFFKKNKSKKLIKTLKTKSAPSPQQIGFEMIMSNLAIIRQELFENLGELPDPEAKRHTLALLDECLEVLNNGSLEEKTTLTLSPEFSKWLGFKQ